VCIQGRRNYLILLLAVCFAVTGSVLTGLSKWDKWKSSDDETVSTAMTTATTMAYATNTTTIDSSN